MKSRLTLLFAFCFLCACETLPKDAFRLSGTALQIREMQTREYSSISDADILSASAAVLQDMGYVIDEVSAPLGVLSASKRADARNMLKTMGDVSLDVVRCVFTFMLACADENFGSVDDVQDIRLTLVSRPQIENDDDVIVRITIQRLVWDQEGRLTAQETIVDREVYTTFFEKMSKAVFIERERI